MLSTAEADDLRKQLQLETSGLSSRDFSRSDLLYYKAHLVFGAVDSLARHPAIVSAAQEALATKDLLLLDSSVPWKPPASTADTAALFPWHQDGTYWGLTPADGVVSCWLALSNATREHGCMRVLRGSHMRARFRIH